MNKKILFLSVFVLFFSALSSSSFAQNLVSFTPQNKVAILEEYTGVNCGWCPSGHAIAEDLKALYGDQVVVVNVHAGSFAVPSAGQFDFRTEFGENLANEMGVAGYPSGTVNRHVFAGATDPALDRGSWAGAVEEIVEEPSPVNLGMKSEFNADTRELTVTVDLYYTGTSPVTTNFINVVFMENDMIGFQSDYVDGNHSDYNHSKVLRHLITGQWGDAVPLPQTFVSKTYTYTVPDEFIIENCDVAAYVSEGNQEIYTGKKVRAMGGTTLVIGDITTEEDLFAGTEIATPVAFDLNGLSLLTAEGDFTITLTGENVPEEWESSFSFNGETYDEMASATLSPNSPNEIVVDVQPCVNPGIATYTLTMASTTFPEAPVVTKKMEVISGINEVLLYNSGAEDWNTIYSDALLAAGSDKMATLNTKSFVNFQKSNSLAGVQNVYYNLSWTFPAFTNSMVEQFASYLDNGGNMMIAGQDIGWDNSGVANSNGTPETIAFYETYMHADYVSDGSTANSEITAIATDEWFGSVANSSIEDIYGGGNVYPEEFTPNNGAVGIFNYNGDATKVGGLRAETDNYKMIYLGFGMEQLGNVDVANSIIQASRDWFNDGVDNSGEQASCEVVIIDGLIDLANEGISLGQNRPNPATGQTIIPIVGLTEAAQFHLYDINGRLVLAQDLEPNTDQIQIQTDELASGLYNYRIQTAKGITAGKKMQIVH